MSKSILFASARMTPPFFWGGAEKSNLTLGLRLDLRGIEVSHFGCYDHFYKETSFLTEYFQELHKARIAYTYENGVLKYRFLNFKCYMTTKKEFLDKFEEYVTSNQIDLVITMLENAPEIIQICNTNNISTLLWVMDMFPVGIAGLKFHSLLDGIIFSSNFLYEKLASKVNYQGYVFHPMFERDWYFVAERYPRYITLINPIEEKGVELFIDITKKMADYEFLVVDGWRKVDKYFPSNVLHLTRQDNMRIIYSQTKLLLVPSLCPEAFGRVIVEAGLNGIPSVASNVGGIPEAILTGGILVDQYMDVDIWINGIRKILSKKNYEEYSQLALESANKNLKDWTDDFIEKFLLSQNKSS
jgi:glycosyltransferase involved in cell wall biosynthesis